ncbi:MAG: FAD:protein FMN transferase [Saprospiraceae bacterium]|nr:FAD:protein FMN transferase [Saprospiraceae bacterium]
MKQKIKKKAHHFPVLLMGCGFVLTAVHEHAQIAWDALRAAKKEIERIEQLISSWREDSQTARINNAAGSHAVQVDKELFDLIERSIKVSKLTCGAFDISGTLSRYYWKFDKKEHSFLSTDKIQELMMLVNYKNIVLDRNERSVYLRKKGMKIGFGGIGKGYAAEKAKSVMLSKGVQDGLVNASGDLIAWGQPPGKNEWDISIPDPRDRKLDLLNVSLAGGSVVTSGSYENFTLIDGKRYSHIINPRSGCPVTHTKNVTVVSPNAEFGDALATALSVLPIEEGIGLVNRLAGVECIIIDTEDNAHFSQQLKTKAYA